MTQVLSQSQDRCFTQCKNPASSVIHPWKTHTICCGYWKTSLRGSKQKRHFIVAFISTKAKLLKTRSTILCLYWMFIKPFFLCPLSIRFRESRTHRIKHGLFVNKARAFLWFIKFGERFIDGVSLK